MQITSGDARYTRYLATVRRLQARYTGPDGSLVKSRGGRPSRPSRLEVLAFWRYVMGDSRVIAAARLAAIDARAQQIAEAA